MEPTVKIKGKKNGSVEESQLAVLDLVSPSAFPKEQLDKVLPIPEHFGLTQVECLEVKNIDLQRQLLQKELARLLLEEQLLSNKISSRARLNVDNYNIDPDKAVCTIRPEVKQQLLAQQDRPQIQPTPAGQT